MPNTDTGPLLADALDGNISGKLALAGRARVVLDRLTRAWGAEWSIQDGAVQVLDPTGTRQPAALALVLSPKTGLLESPVKTQRGAKWKSWLMADQLPGAYVTLESEFIKGSFKAESIHHTGDTHGQPWHTEAEGVKL